MQSIHHCQRVFYKMDGRYSDRKLQILSINCLLLAVANCLCVLGWCEESLRSRKCYWFTILCYLRDISKDRLYSWKFLHTNIWEYFEQNFFYINSNNCNGQSNFGQINSSLLYHLNSTHTNQTTQFKLLSWLSWRCTSQYQVYFAIDVFLIFI